MGSVHWCCRDTGMCLENLLPTSSPVVESLLVSERGLGGAADDPSARSLCEASVHPSSRPYQLRVATPSPWELQLAGPFDRRCCKVVQLGFSFCGVCQRAEWAATSIPYNNNGAGRHLPDPCRT